MELNKQQQEVVNSAAPHILIEAGVGSGKTETLIHMAEAHKDKQIVLITFTNEAADEIKRRLTFTPAFVGTIHKFCYLLLRRLSREFNFRLNLQRDEQAQLTIKALIKEDIDLSDLSGIYNYILNTKYYLSINKNVPRYFIKIKNEYEQLKHRINFFDMTDSPRYLLEKLKYYPVKLEYDYLFVDEAQDLSIDQFELIKYLPIENKILIGDRKQSIYMWRDADGSVFDRFKALDYTVYTLDLNYRSYQEILDYANAGMVAIKGYGGKIFTDLDELIQMSPQILCRANAEVQKIKSKYPKVSTIHAAKGLEYDYVLLVDFLENTDEEHNVKYVGMTRAKNGLGIFPITDVLKSLKLNF